MMERERERERENATAAGTTNNDRNAGKEK